MAETPDTSYEEAKRCPKCKQPGNVRLMRPAPNIRGAMLHMIYCENELCVWHDEVWMVQVNADGSVPPPTDHRGEQKIYVGFENHDQMARDILRMLEAQQKLETEGHGEIRNPHSG